MRLDVRAIVRRSVWASIAYFVFSDWLAGRRMARGDIERPSGSARGRRSVCDSLEYIDGIYDAYFRWSGIGPESIRGKTVLEVGPGDNLGVALRFLCDGAAQVICLDRFSSAGNQVRWTEIYGAMRARLEGEALRNFDESVGLYPEVTFNPDRISYVTGVPIEDSGYLLRSESVDLIVSMAVMEELRDPDSAIALMDRVLVRGGLMLHGIDFRDYGLFSAAGHHPLTFLTVSDPVYRLMSWNTGRPNRMMVNYYRDRMASMGYGHRLLVSRVLGRDAPLVPHKERLESGVDYEDATLQRVEAIRPHLLPRYRPLPAVDLLVGAAFLSARKP